MSSETQSVAFMLPVLPDRIEQDRRVMRDLWNGERRAEHEAARKRLGITRESAWLQPVPDGAVVVVLVESPDLDAALAGVATSTEPFVRWFRDHCREVHGVDLEAGFPPPEQLLDFRA